VSGYKVSYSTVYSKPSWLYRNLKINSLMGFDCPEKFQYPRRDLIKFSSAMGPVWVRLIKVDTEGIFNTLMFSTFFLHSICLTLLEPFSKEVRKN
jgi:hypothetical protein